MNKEHITLLRKNRLAIVQDLEPRPVLNSLYQDGIFDENDLDVVNSLPTRQEKAEKILDTVPRRGPKAFDAFHRALLSNDSQRHLAFLLKCNISTEGKNNPTISFDLKNSIDLLPLLVISNIGLHTNCQNSYD